MLAAIDALVNLGEQFKSLPGVRAVSATSHLPISGRDSRRGITIEGRERTPDSPTRAHTRSEPASHKSQDDGRGRGGVGRLEASGHAAPGRLRRTRLVLAAAGIHGVMSHLVALRTAEIGVRMTLGASPAAVMGLVLREGALQAAIGLAIGLTGGVLLMRAFGTVVFGVAPADPITGRPRWSSSSLRRLGARITPFEACSGFTRDAARTLADPP